MKLALVSVCLLLPIIINAVPLPNGPAVDEVFSPDNMMSLPQTKVDWLDLILRLYGNTKISSIMKPYSIRVIKDFFNKFTHYYYDIANAVEPFGIHFPPYEKFNWNAIQSSDYDIARKLFGDDTIRMLLTDPDYFDRLWDKILADPTLIPLFFLRVEQMGIIIDDVDAIDVDALAEAAVEVLIPMIPDFAPYAVNILLFG